MEEPRWFLDRGEQVTTNDPYTTLHVAVLNNLPDMLESLLEQGDLDVNVRNSNGETALFCAVKENRKNLVDILIASGANVNLANEEEVARLHLATKNPDIAHILIKNGANINAVDCLGLSPLHRAVNKNCLETVSMLLYYKADANIRSKDNMTPFMLSLVQKKVKLQEALIEYVYDFNAKFNGEPLIYFALRHRTPFLEEIIDRGADVNYVHPTRNSFYMCVQTQNQNAFRLIWNKFDRYQKLSIHQSYLMTIVDLNISKCLDVILNSGNVIPLVESLFESDDDLHHFVSECYSNNVPLRIITEFVCLLCSFGYVPSSLLLDKIYSRYGFCDLFKFLLYMDINLVEPSSTCIMSRLIYDVTLSVDEFMGNVCQRSVCEPMIITRRQWREQSLAAVCQFIMYPKLVNVIKLEDFPKVPCLQDLSRNVFRDYVIRKFNFKRSCQYFSYLNNLNIPVAHKDILSFKSPLYNVKLRKLGTYESLDIDEWGLIRWRI